MDPRKDCLWTEEDSMENLPCIEEKGVDERTCLRCDFYKDGHKYEEGLSEENPIICE